MRGALFTLGLVILGSVLGLAGTDLVLPAVPSLPDALGGTAAMSQLVLATYVAGVGLGLLLFGALSSRFDPRSLLIAALAGFAAVSWFAADMTSLDALIGIRFVQGTLSAAAPVFAPGIIRALFDERGAIRAIGALGSIESLTPALAPVAGVALLKLGGWQVSFRTLGVAAMVVAFGLWVARRQIPDIAPPRQGVGYGRLLRKVSYLRHAVSQALTLGALLTFVFGAPTVIVSSMGGTITDFIIMQISGITTFILAANGAEYFVSRFGAERIVMVGSVVSALGALGLTIYAMLGVNEPIWLVPLFIPMNFGLGLRGPPGFYSAIVEADGDDARGSALMILAVMIITAAGTATVAPFIENGLRPLMIVALALSWLSPLLLVSTRAGQPELAEAE